MAEVHGEGEGPRRKRGRRGGGAEWRHRGLRDGLPLCGCSLPSFWRVGSELGWSTWECEIRCCEKKPRCSWRSGTGKVVADGAGIYPSSSSAIRQPHHAASLGYLLKHLSVAGPAAVAQERLCVPPTRLWLWSVMSPLPTSQLRHYSMAQVEPCFPAQPPEPSCLSNSMKVIVLHTNSAFEAKMCRSEDKELQQKGAVRISTGSDRFCRARLIKRSFFLAARRKIEAYLGANITTLFKCRSALLYTQSLLSGWKKGIVLYNKRFL